jgi:predicted DNA-binding protein
MARKLSRLQPRIGRPPAGAREGERVKDYPQLSIRVPAGVKATLQALSVVRSRPQWRLIVEAIDCYLRDRPEDERRVVEELSRRKRGRASAGARPRLLKKPATRS